jgi:ribosome biogenesis SPOUT family RNA methylase Rps3
MTEQERYSFDDVVVAGGVLGRRAKNILLVWDVVKQCSHRRLHMHSLSILDAQHLFKQINESSYFTFDALHFL